MEYQIIVSETVAHSWVWHVVRSDGAEWTSRYNGPSIEYATSREAFDVAQTFAVAEIV